MCCQMRDSAMIEFKGGLIVMIFFYINFKLFFDHIISLRLPKGYLNSHNCSFDINIVKIPTIWSLYVGAEPAAFSVKKVCSSIYICTMQLVINLLHQRKAIWVEIYDHQYPLSDICHPSDYLMVSSLVLSRVCGYVKRPQPWIRMLLTVLLLLSKSQIQIINLKCKNEICITKVIVSQNILLTKKLTLLNHDFFSVYSWILMCRRFLCHPAMILPCYVIGDNFNTF